MSCLVSPLSLCVSSVTVWSSSCSHHPELVVTPEYTHDDDGDDVDDDIGAIVIVDNGVRPQ